MRGIYLDDGGETLVVNTKIKVGDNATFEGAVIPEVMDSIEDSTATTVAALKEDFNALLAAMRAAGLIAEASESDG